MSDAVMVPNLRDAAQAVVDRWEAPLWKDVEPTAHVIARLRQALAASTPVGGWEDISTAPKDGVTEAECLCIDQLPFDLAMKVYRALAFQRRAAPPPPVSIDNGDHVGEAADMVSGAAAWDREICTGCTSSLSIADIKARGVVSCCPDRHMVRIGDLVDAYQGSRPQEAVPPELSDADGVVLCEGDTVEFIRDTNGHFRGDRATVTYTFPVPMIGGWTAPHPSCFRHVRQPADGCSSNEGAG